jgi:hypothetical protein
MEEREQTVRNRNQNSPEAPQGGGRMAMNVTGALAIRRGPTLPSKASMGGRGKGAEAA